METLMKHVNRESPFNRIPAWPRSLLSPVGHRVFAVLLLLLIAVVTIASTTGGKPPHDGANLMLAPGRPGLEAALY
jgi:hypothetical protein